MKVLLLAALLITSLPVFAADSSAVTTTVAPPRGPRHGPRPRPMPPRRDHFSCTARDRFQRAYRGEGWNLNDARRDALRTCQARSVVRGCQVVACDRR